MVNRPLVTIALAGEGALVVIALVWQRLRDIPMAMGGLWEGVLIGTGAAVVLALFNWYVLCRAPGVRPVTAIRRLYRESLRPLFGGVGAADAVVISVAAGIGEELLFRGVLQPEVGLVLASVIFGVLHMGGTGTLVFGCWVAVMGAVMGGVAVWTGGLLAPIVCHALYDAAALTYIRRASDCAAVREDGESDEAEPPD